MTRKILTLRQAAQYLKVNKSTIYRLVRRKQLPAFKVCRDWRFELELIDRWRVAQEQTAKVCTMRSALSLRVEARRQGDSESRDIEPI
ncbi:MAG: helix-turn-helix domain-containing protein [Deltaproteobacteria bacterium]|nr:helix-turn-helix domain-containing protein [Deltaproteobacteria bacterium]